MIVTDEVTYGLVTEQTWQRSCPDTASSTKLTKAERHSFLARSPLFLPRDPLHVERSCSSRRSYAA
jgi:hypothetical protein